jgi:hypothetical protein
MLPILLTRGASQPAVVQAGLVGTMLHLFGCAAIGGGMFLVKSLRLEGSFLFWLLGLYWLTLVVLVACVVRAIKTADLRLHT